MSTWQARPTTYKGIPMRSRLEARFAADLDAGGLDWEYEPRAFADESGQYLPDFYVPSISTYIEVRPTIEGAYRAFSQMPVIWSSEPTATLWVFVPDAGIGWSAESHGKKWTICEVAL